MAWPSQVYTGLQDGRVAGNIGNRQGWNLVIGFPDLFDVKVLEVRTMRMPRKSRRVGKFMGRRPEWKKAIVRLAEGQTIEFFEGV